MRELVLVLISLIVTVGLGPDRLLPPLEPQWSALAPAPLMFDGSEWQQGPIVPTTRNGPAVVAIGRRVYVIGGVNLNGGRHSDVVESIELPGE